VLHFWYLCVRIVAVAFLKPRVSPRSTITLRFFCSPWVSDNFYVMNASRYSEYSDAGRWELAVRIGLFSYLKKNRITVHLAGQKITYFKGLPCLRFFNLEMKLIGFDENWIYVAQAFTRNGKVHCYILTKLVLMHKGKRVSHEEKLKEAGIPHISPNNPLAQEFSNDRSVKDLVTEFLRD